jgi:transposase
MQATNLTHQKWIIGPGPIIQAVLDKLEFSSLLGKFVKNERYVSALEVLVRSILVAPSALYRIPEWNSLFESGEGSPLKLDDDVIGRALDALFACDRATLQTRLTIKTVERYKIDTGTIHNDSTTVKFYGAYKSQSPKAIQLKRGHSKDHRPDLKQLVYNLSVTEDGTIPVHFKCFDGNRTDDTIHIETWLTLRGILGRADFLYVADSKLCTSENMRTIDKEGGRFVTIVPDTRRETADFAESCFESEVRWLPLTRRQVAGKKDCFDVFQVAEGTHQLREGFRIFWYRSSEKRRRDAESRKERIDQALEKLGSIDTERRRGPKSEKTLKKRAHAILSRYSAEQWIDFEVRIKESEEFKKRTRGKPTPDASYRRIVKKQPYLVVSKNFGNIAQSETLDGIFPLATNAKLDAKETLNAYKYQPHLEKRFSWTKSDYQVAPVFLKKNARIEALMFACYIADLVAAIIQRQLRVAMKSRNIRQLQTLPEERPSETPTWEQLQRLFAHHAKYHITQNGNLLTTFWDKLSDHQQKVLNLLRIPLSAYSG